MLWDEPNVELKCQSVRRDMMFLASNSLQILRGQNDHAHVIMQGICKKFIEVNFSVGCMVSQPNRLYQRSTTMFLTNKRKKIFLEQIFFNVWAQCIAAVLSGLPPLRRQNIATLMLTYCTTTTHTLNRAVGTWGAGAVR